LLQNNYNTGCGGRQKRGKFKGSGVEEFKVEKRNSGSDLLSSVEDGEGEIEKGVHHRGSRGNAEKTESWEVSQE